MSLEQLSLLIGIGTALALLMLFVIKVTLQVSRSMDSNTFAIHQINDTITKLWTKHDDLTESVNDHGIRIATVETRLDYHEEAHATPN